ncbi:FBP domain-containing protein [Stackebrandtia albiflava]
MTGADFPDLFANCSKREAAAIPPPDLDAVEWAEIDFLAWRNPRTPQRAYVAVPHGAGVIGLVFRMAANRNTAGAMRSTMCELCHTVHSSGGVTLFTANKAGVAGRRGDSVGCYMCTDLDCSRYIRGVKRPKRIQPPSTLTVDERRDRLRTKLDGLVGMVMAG